VKKWLSIHYPLYRYHLQATINQQEEHFIITINDSSDHLFTYNDLQGVREVQHLHLYAETPVYVLEN